MRAKIDDGSDFSPWGLIPRIYTDQFLAGISEQFGFKIQGTETERDIREAGARYILGARLDEEDPSFHKTRRKDYVKFLRATEKFGSLLETFDAEKDISTQMLWGARILNEPKPQTEFPELSDHDQKRGPPYYFELVRLLNILKAGVDFEIQNSTSIGGRPKSTGLLIFINRIADVWIINLERRFSIDYHEGSGVTEAFDFIKALLSPLDDIPDARIVTAMRAEIHQRGTHNNLFKKMQGVIDSEIC